MRVHYRIVLLLQRIAPRRAKRIEELSYWQDRRAAEGVLENHWYRDSFTTAFGIPDSFYAGRRLLDVGCGPRGSLEWATEAQERVGVDPLAKQYVRLNEGRHSMAYVAARAEKIPFPDGHFDVVSLFNSLDHVDDLDATIAEVTRVTAPGGTVLLMTEVNHAPTITEPRSLSWDVLERFEGFEVSQERRLEKRGPGVHSSALESVPYDDDDPSPRCGTLVARLERRRA